MNRFPMVSCLMATYNRRGFVPLAIRWWMEQSYPNKELIVLDDGEDAVGDLMPDDYRVRYVRLEGRMSKGEKLNLGIRTYATGDVFAMWDDDDWHGPERLRLQVQALVTPSSGRRGDPRHSGAGDEVGICGVDRMYFYDLRTRRLWEYVNTPGGRSRSYVVGGSMMFRRWFWEERPFDHIPDGREDNRFIAGRVEDGVSAVVMGGGAIDESPVRWYVAMVHGGNMSGERDFEGGSDCWREVGEGQIMICPYLEEVARVYNELWQMADSELLMEDDDEG